MTSHIDDTDTLLEQLFELPQAQWADRLDVLCRRHPSHADQLRRRHGLLAATGLDREPVRNTIDGVPEQFGDFRLRRRLGSGGMGMVFVAEQRSLAREVAIKFVRPDLMYSAFARERFRREIEAIAQLEHPAIVPILVHDQDGDVPYYVMPLVQGASCADAIERLQGKDPSTLTRGDLQRTLGDVGPRDAEGVFDGAYWQACVRLIRQAALGLDHAHRRGIVHRDVKPSNLLFTVDGRALVVDFGLAHVASDARITRSQAAPGSPAYMSPEQLLGRACDGRTDVYSLAITLEHLLALRHPLPVDDSDAMRSAILSGRRGARPPGSIPVELAIVLAAASDPDSDRRHATAQAFADDLQAVLEQRPIRARALPRSLRVRRWMRRHPTTTTALVLGAVLLTATPALVVAGIAGERDRALSAEAIASRNAYEASIAAASSALRAGDGAEALRRLDTCPEVLRGFEWRHLRLALAGRLRDFVGHDRTVTAVAILPDASVMASGDEGGQVRLWHPLRDSAGPVLEVGARQPIVSLSLSADARKLVVVQDAQRAAAAGGVGPTVRVFDVETAALLATRQSNIVGERLCFASDGQSLLVLDGFAVQELDPFTLAPTRAVQLQQVGTAPSDNVVFDGEWLFSNCGATLQAWHVRTGEGQVLHDAFTKVVACAAAADRRGIAAFAVPDGCLLAEVEPLRVRTIPAGRSEMDRVAMDASGGFLLAVGADNAFRTWDTATGRRTGQAFVDPERSRVVAVASRRLLAAVGGSGGSLALFGMLGSADRQTLMGHSGVVSKLAVTTDGVLLSASHEAAVRAWNPTSGTPTAATGLPYWVNALAVSEDGGHVFAAFRGRIRRLQLPGLVAGEEMDTGGKVIHLFPGQGSRLVALLPDRLIEVDFAGGVGASVALPGGPAVAACSPPDGGSTFIALAGTVQHWSLPAGIELLASIPIAGASAIACTRDARSLFTSEQRWLRRRRADGGELVWERACASPVSSLLLLPDESRLVAGHEDGTVSLWRPDHNDPVATLQTGSLGIRDLIADPNGLWLAAADRLATLTLFRARLDDEEFPARLARADATAATWLDEKLRRTLGAQALVLAAIAAHSDLDEELRQAMVKAELLRAPLTWEAVARALDRSRTPAQSPRDYEGALHLAELALREEFVIEIARLAAAFATLRLDRAADAMQHCDWILQQRFRDDVLIGTARAVRSMALWQLQRFDEARADLAAAEALLAARTTTDEVRLLAEVRRVVRR
ncbi:MAG: serine/threonine-protein kinase [Planctomycetota bacterium]